MNKTGTFRMRNFVDGLFTAVEFCLQKELATASLIDPVYRDGEDRHRSRKLTNNILNQEAFIEIDVEVLVNFIISSKHARVCD